MNHTNSHNPKRVHKIRKNNIFLLPLFCLICLYSCVNKDDFMENNNAITSPVKTRAIGDAKYDALGCGYDCTSSYFEGSTGIRLVPVIDLDRFLSGNGIDPETEQLVTMKPGAISEGIMHGDTKTEETWGKDVNEYVKNINGKASGKINIIGADKISLFSGSLKANINDSSRFSSMYSFYKLSAIKTTRELTLSSSNPQELKYFLTERFCDDVKSLSGDELVEKYGTHILTNMKLGGIAYVLYTAATTSEQDYTSFKVSANAHFSIISTNASVNSQQSIFNETNDIKIQIRTMGGSEHISIDNAAQSGNDLLSIKSDYSKWLSSVDRSSEQLIGVTNEDEIHPLSEFIWNPNKKKEVEDAIIRYANKYVIKNLHNNFINIPMRIINSENMDQNWLCAEGDNLVYWGHSRKYVRNQNSLPKLLVFIPHGKYYLISYVNGNTYLDSDKKFKSLTQSNSQLWNVKTMTKDGNEVSPDSKYYGLKIENVENGSYLGSNLQFNYRDEPYNNGLIWEIFIPKSIDVPSSSDNNSGSRSYSPGDNSNSDRRSDGGRRYNSH